MAAKTHSDIDFAVDRKGLMKQRGEPDQRPLETSAPRRERDSPRCEVTIVVRDDIIPVALSS